LTQLRFNSAGLAVSDEEIEYKSDQKAQESYVARAIRFIELICTFFARLRRDCENSGGLPERRPIADAACRTPSGPLQSAKYRPI